MTINPGDMSEEYRMECLARWIVREHAKGDPAAVTAWLEGWGQRHGEASRRMVRGWCAAEWRAAA